MRSLPARSTARARWYTAAAPRTRTARRDPRRRRHRFLPDWFDSLDRVLALDWDRMIPGHPYAGGRFGTKDDVRELKQYMTDPLSDAVKVAANQGKCFDAAMKEIKLPKYEKWGNYEQFLPGNIERFCEYWGRAY